MTQMASVCLGIVREIRVWALNNDKISHERFFYAMVRNHQTTASCLALGTGQGLGYV